MTVEVELLNPRRLPDRGRGLYFDPTVGIKLVPGDLYGAVVGLTKNQVVPPVDIT
jgi:hypothetical protein